MRSMALLDIEYTTSLIFYLIPLLCFFILSFRSYFAAIISSSKNSGKLPKSYPIIGSYFAIKANSHRRAAWTYDVVSSLPNLTFTLRRPLGHRQVYTANPQNVEHILKTRFDNYRKGAFSHSTNRDFLGDGIFNVDGEKWKFQRQVSSHEFNTKSLRRFVEAVVDSEISGRLIPILSDSAKSGTVLDFQEIFQRFAFDNICKIAFGYDPEYLIPGLPDAEFPVAFEEATRLISQRLNAPFPVIWKFKRALNIGSEKQLRKNTAVVRDFAKEITRKKGNGVGEEIHSVDILSRFLNSGYQDEDFVTDAVVSFILAGRDTTSAVLTWFFWLIFRHPEVEKEILGEIQDNNLSENLTYEEVKDMPYTHAALYETMRLYPPVPLDTKAAENDDVLPDGTFVKKGTRVIYHPYAMGRVEAVWGADWPEFRPERWLEAAEGGGGKRRFVGKDAFTFPVFQAGPRVCLGKEMAMLQMKAVVAGVMRRFRVVPVIGEGVEPVFVSYLTSKMQGGFPVRIEARESRI